MYSEPGYNLVLRIKDKRFWVKFRTTTVQFGREEVSQVATTCIIREIGGLQTFSDTVICNPNDRENVYAGCRFALKKIVHTYNFSMLFDGPISVVCTFKSMGNVLRKEGKATNPDEIWDLFRKELWDKLGSKLIVPKE